MCPAVVGIAGHVLEEAGDQMHQVDSDGQRWFVSRGGETFGPYLASDVEQGIRNGAFGPGNFVRDEQSAWAPIEQSRFASCLAKRPAKGLGFFPALLFVLVGSGAFVWVALKTDSAASDSRSAARAAEAQQDAYRQSVRQTMNAAAEKRHELAIRLGSQMNEADAPPVVLGVDSTVLRPSEDEAKCLLWGAAWYVEVADELRQLGFVELSCRTASWPL